MEGRNRDIGGWNRAWEAGNVKNLRLESFLIFWERILEEAKLLSIFRGAFAPPENLTLA